jgi:phage-related minor tail protein
LLVSLGGLGYKAITSADDLNTLSKQTGISTAELQKMQYASDLVDVSLDDITGALKKMKGNMDGHAESWERIGVSTMNADGSMRDATEVFKDVLKGLSQIENETERDQIAMDLFGKSADSLAGIIDDGGAALEEYGQKAEEMGMILSQDTLDSLNATNDTIDETKMALAGAFAQLGATVATVLVPLIQKASSLIQTIADKLGKLSPEQLKVIGTIAAVVAAIAPLLGVLGKVISTVGTIMTFAPKIVGALTAINPAVLAVIAVIGALVAAGVWLYNNWDLVIEWAGKLKDKVVAAWESVKAGISNAANAIKGAVDNMKSKVTAAWENVKSAATSVKDNVVNAFNNLRDKIGNVVSGITGKIDALKSMFDSAREHMRGVIDKIKNMFNFEWTIPKIKLPHLKITGKLDLFADPPKIPSVSIDWYRKAYDNPLMFTSPTVLPTASGLKGFGDGHGAEIVMGLDKLRELVGAQEAQPVIINVYPTEGMDVNQLAEKIQARFVALEQQRSLAYA